LIQKRRAKKILKKLPQMSNRSGQVAMGHNGLPLAVSGGFGTKNCQTKIKVKWKTKN